MQMHPNPENEKCCFHPQHMIIGVCAFCLNERLLILASKQRDHQNNNNNSFKFFAITASLLNRFDNLRHNKKLAQEYYQYDSADSTSPEDSFISMKFEGSGGVGSWEKNTTKPKVSIEQYHDNNYYINQNLKGAQQQDHQLFGVTTATAVIEHSKTRGPLRWRKRIGHHLFQFITWKKRPNSSHVPSNLEGSVKVRHGWIRNLTNRRPKD